VTFSFVYEISPEPLNGFAPNSYGTRVWSLARTSLKVKVKVTRDKKTAFSALSAACAQFMFGKTCLACSSFSVFWGALPPGCSGYLRGVQGPSTSQLLEMTAPCCIDGGHDYELFQKY